MIVAILTVTAMATFEIYAALVAAHAFGLDPWVILGCTLTGWDSRRFYSCIFWENGSKNLSVKK